MRTTITRRRWTSFVVAAMVAGHAANSPTRAGQDASRGSTADRAAFMQQHFASVMSLHEAVTRGDLAESRRIAAGIAERPGPAGIVEALEPYVAIMQAAARRVTGDVTLEDAAASTAAMLAACGDCHRAAGTMPAPISIASPAVGGLVGHMLAHQRAVDLMVQGLTVPSTSAWHEGTTILAAAPLRDRELPRDSKLTKAIRTAEARVHDLAERSASADDTRSRIYIYSELVQSCANCHSLHQKVWGPRRQ